MTSGTCLLIAFVFLGLGIGLGIIGFRLDEKRNPYFTMGPWWYSGLILLIAGIVGFLIMGIGSIGYYEQERWDSAIENKYTFYYDGEVIEHPENYNYNSFKIHYDDENKKVLMGRDSDNGGGTIIMPVVTP